MVLGHLDFTRLKLSESNAYLFLVSGLLFKANKHQPWLWRCCNGANAASKEHVCTPKLSRLGEGKTGQGADQKHIQLILPRLLRCHVIIPQIDIP